MPEISRFYGIIIGMFYHDHNPPHFHARYGEYSIDISIRDFSVINGSFPPRALGFVVEWASLHRDELMKNWEAACQEKPLEPIDPLL
jgi:hypothetical protein